MKFKKTLYSTVLVIAVGCGATKAPEIFDTAKTTGSGSVEKEQPLSWQQKSRIVQSSYLSELIPCYKQQTNAYWKAANTGKKEDFDAFATADFQLKKLHSNREIHNQIKEILAHRNELDAITARSLAVAELEFRGNQLPGPLLEAISTASADVEQIFASFRGQLNGKKYSDNQLKELLKNEQKTKKRKAIWEAMKQVGAEAAPKIIELATLRNEAAKTVGYRNYWEMALILQEQTPEEMLAIFSELENVTDELYSQTKSKIDKELTKRLRVKPNQIMPWHFDNPFFQTPPPSAKMNLDDFFKNKTDKEIVALGEKYFADINLPVESIIENSDFYERDGKNQHAFCTDIDREGDVRILVNVKPTARWMETTLHELGHAVYSKYTDYQLPYNLRNAAHVFTTEAVAMLFGSLTTDPSWLQKYAGVDADTIAKKTDAISEQRKREQLVFARWTMVMFHFEKALYENPERDLNNLWWDYVERFQGLKRPADRNQPDWASKIHFAIAPIYYHNYMLGELFAAQLRATLGRISGHKEAQHSLDFTVDDRFAKYFKEKIFAPAASVPWPDFVRAATDEPLTAKYFASEVK